MISNLDRLAEIKDTDKAKWCPECGSTIFKQAFDGERECKGCGQSWYADVAYSGTIANKIVDCVVDTLRAEFPKMQITNER